MNNYLLGFSVGLTLGMYLTYMSGRFAPPEIRNTSELVLYFRGQDPNDTRGTIDFSNMYARFPCDSGEIQVVSITDKEILIECDINTEISQNIPRYHGNYIGGIYPKTKKSYISILRNKGE